MVRERKEEGELKPALIIVHLKDSEDLTQETINKKKKEKETVNGDKEKEMGLRISGSRIYGWNCCFWLQCKSTQQKGSIQQNWSFSYSKCF